MPGPRFYASGPAAPRFAALREYGLDIRVLDGPLSAASALKMSYAGITKGTQAIGAAMMLAATRGGSAEALLKELEFSQKDLLAMFRQQLPLMPAKAYRWIAEMQEIAGFVGDDPAARELYQGAAHFYERIAEDFNEEKNNVVALLQFLGNRHPAARAAFRSEILGQLELVRDNPSTSSTMRAIVRKFAGVISCSGTSRPNSVSTESMRLTKPSDESPQARRSSSGPIGLAMD